MDLTSHFLDVERISVRYGSKALVIIQIVTYSLQMSKRLIVFLSILSLTVSLPLIPANAAVKVGASCKTVGITSVASGKTFTCIKSGKKLVWNKGVSNPIEKVSSPLVVVGDLTSADSIIKAALDNFKNYTSTTRSAQEVKVVAQTGVDQQLVTWVQEGAKYVAQRFAYPKLPRSFVDFIAIDSTWLQLSYLAEGYSTSYAKFRSDDFCHNAPACGGSDSNVFNFTVIKNNNLLVNDKSGMAQTSGHEFFHAIQENLAGFAPNATGSNVPNWFWEGPAMFVGLQTTGALGFVDYLTLGRDSMTQRYKNGNPTNRTSYLSEIKANDGVTDPYAIGFAATELLVSQVGVEKLVNIYAELGKGKGFDAAFEQGTGIKLVDFYSMFEKVRGTLGFPKG